MLRLVKSTGQLSWNLIRNDTSYEYLYSFAFDHVYDMNTHQQKVYEDIGEPLLDRAFGGYK